MLRLLPILALLLLASPSPAAPLAEVEGTVTWEDGFPAPAGARISVRLVEIGEGGGDLRTLAEIVLAPGRRPVPFRLVYDEALAPSAGTYRLLAEMRLGDSLVMRNRLAVPFLVDEDDLVPELELARVSAGRGEGSPLGREWTAETVFGEATPPWARVWVRFDEDGTVSGSNGCNAFEAEAPLSEETLEFERIATTRKACRTEQRRVEKTVTRALEDTALWRIEAGRLILSDAAGLDLMALRPGR